MIFKRIGEGRPYPDHGLKTDSDWSAIPPRVVRLDELITTKTTLDLSALLAADSTFFGDLFPHVVHWGADLYLEDGLHRALRVALHQRSVIHARIVHVSDGGEESNVVEKPSERRSGRDSGLSFRGTHPAARRGARRFR